MSASDLAKVPASSGPVIQIPDILGGVTLSYNLPGVSKRLRLDAATIAGIFDGSIKTWNASQITALNPGVTLPSHAIVPEVRADSSGTTYIFTDYLTTAAPSVWTLGTSKTITWPSVAVQTPKNSGVAASIQSTPYSIGYVELAYALQNNFTFAAVKNAAGAVRGALAGHAWPPTPTRGSTSRRPTSPSSTSRGRPATRSPGTAGPSCCRSRRAPPPAPRWSRSSTGPPTPAAARTWPPAWATSCSPRPSRTRTGPPC